MFPRLGIYPGVLSPLSVGGLPLTEKTIAATLKTAGYVTGALGVSVPCQCVFLRSHSRSIRQLYTAFLLTVVSVCTCVIKPLKKWHLGTNEYLPTNHGFDYYFGAPMTQNECYSNIHFPGSTSPSGNFGPCPLLNGSTDAVWRQVSQD